MPHSEKAAAAHLVFPMRDNLVLHTHPDFMTEPEVTENCHVLHTGGGKSWQMRNLVWRNVAQQNCTTFCHGILGPKPGDAGCRTIRTTIRIKKNCGGYHVLPLNPVSQVNSREKQIVGCVAELVSCPSPAKGTLLLGKGWSQDHRGTPAAALDPPPPHTKWPKCLAGPDHI